jgi:hypothetical protein
VTSATSTGELTEALVARYPGNGMLVTSHVMEQLGKEWDGWTAHDDTCVVDGQNAVVLARCTATNKATGKPAVRRHRSRPRRHALGRAPNFVKRPYRRLV